jgi:hexokinase
MLLLHQIDNQLDALTPNEGKQRYEKMISGMYLGELTRLALYQLATEGAVFASASGGATLASLGALNTPWTFTTAMMSDIGM